ncbi:MAG: hypothetical protein HYX68_15795 [Planctomycetes bacterium]|nr:hypothetical protein [Planctomycetota bacterium]
MARHVSFFRLPEEGEFFLRLIASVRETVVFPKFEAATRKKLVAIPLEDFIPRRKVGTALALAQPKAKIYFQRSPRRCRILASRSQILTYWIGRVLKESRLEYNWLEFETSYVNDKMEWVYADKDFLKWGDKVCKVIRDNTVVWKNRRITKKARQAINEGQYTF